MIWRRLGGLMLAAALLVGTAHAHDDGQRVAGARPDIATDEGGIWAIADRAEEEARASAELNRDPALNAYVRDIVCKVSGPHCADIRVYVMDRPYFNAMMAPNGYMEVWSGLMLRAENEAQLAFVLGHEAGHFVENHSIEQWRTLRTRATGMMFVSIITGIAGVGFIGDIAYLGTIASIFGFSREAEEEADEEGFRLAVANGYDARAGAELWRRLMEENAASDFEKIRKQGSRSSLFATHPVTKQRIAALDEMAAKQGGAPGRTERERYRQAIRPHLLSWLRDDLRRRDFGASLHLIQRLQSDGQDLGVLKYAEAEAYRLRRKEGDAELALAAYEASARQLDAPAEAWRELGDLYARAGRTAEAIKAFDDYLSRAGQAADRDLVLRRRNQLAEKPQ